jgi:hypothetical protein
MSSYPFERVCRSARCGGVADGRSFVDAKDGDQVQRVGAVDQCLVESTVDAGTFQGRGETA